MALSEEDDELRHIADIAQVLKQVYNTVATTASKAACTCLRVVSNGEVSIVQSSLDVSSISDKDKNSSANPPYRVSPCR